MTELEKKINFQAFGRTILIELGNTETRGGIVLPQQSNAANIIEPDEAFEVISISESASNEVGIEVGEYIYITPHCMPFVKITTNKKRYAVIEIQDISGIAPNGFDRKQWEKNKKDIRAAISSKIIAKSN